MPLAFPVGPLALLLLTQASVLAEPSRQDECAAASARVELAAEPGAKAPVVCLTPGLPLTFSFDSPLVGGAVRLGEPEWFEDTATGKQMLTLKPRERLEAGRRSRVEVCFEDGAAPACATFVLVTHPGLGLQEVKVSRQKRPVESYQQAEREARAEAERCREEVRQLRAEREAPEGLRGALASGLVGEKGISPKVLTESVTEREGNALSLARVRTWRAKGRVAAEVKLENPSGTRPWVAEGAVLRGAKGEVLEPLPLWQSAPIAPGQAGHVVVEVLATEKEAQGTYTLTLWDADQKRTVTLGHVTFP